MNENSKPNISLCESCVLVIYSEKREPLELLDICVECISKILTKPIQSSFTKSKGRGKVKRKKYVNPILSRSEPEPGICDCCTKNSLVQFIGEIPLCQGCSTTFIASSASLRSERLPIFVEASSPTYRTTTSSKTICYFPDTSSDSDIDEQFYEKYFEYDYSKVLREIAEKNISQNQQDFEDCLIHCGLLPDVPKSDPVKHEVITETTLKLEEISHSDVFLENKEESLIQNHLDPIGDSRNIDITSSTDELTVSRNNLTGESVQDGSMGMIESTLKSERNRKLMDFMKSKERNPYFNSQAKGDDTVATNDLLNIVKRESITSESSQNNCNHRDTEHLTDYLDNNEDITLVESYPSRISFSSGEELEVPLKLENSETLIAESADFQSRPCNSYETGNTATLSKPSHATAPSSIQTTPRKRGRPRKYPITGQKNKQLAETSLMTVGPANNSEKSPVNDNSTPPPPRKRGRPRKYPIAQNPAPKRPRGRPRKYPLINTVKESLSGDAEHCNLLKAPPPRKHQTTPDQNLPLHSRNETISGSFQTRGTTSKISKLVENELDVHRFEKNQRVKVLYNDGFWYAGRMMEMFRGKIRIHYDEWDSSHDEWIDSQSKRIYIYAGENDEGPVSRRQKRLITGNMVKLEEDMAQLSSFIKHKVESPGNRNYESTVTQAGEEIADFIEKRTRERSTISVSASSVDESSPLPEEQGSQLDEISELAGRFNTPNTMLPYEDQMATNQDLGEPNFLDAWRDSGINESNEFNQVTPEMPNLPRGYNLRSSINMGNEPPTNSTETTAAKEAKKRRTSRNVFKERFKVGSTLEVRDRLKEWCTGTVIAIKGYRILIHYEGWPSTHDEWIEINSKRLKPNTIVEKKEKFEEKELDRLVEEQIANIEKKVIIRRRKPNQREEPVLMAEYFDESNVLEGVESEKWKVYCNQCKVVIRQIRYYCTYCENPSEGYDYESFDLCLWCFSRKFPRKHQHPRSSFAVEYIMEDSNIELAPIIGELVTKYEKDLFDESYTEIDGKPYMQAVLCEEDRSHISLLKWKKRKICAFCNDEDPNILGGFIGPQPFVYIKVTKEGSKKRKSFWAHDACARYSPEVIQTKEGDWYNVSMALNRGRKMRCAVCKEKGATIGCFEAKCPKSYHILCTKKPMPHFEKGVIFWCPQHESIRSKKEKYNDVFSCDVCNRSFQDDNWFTCVPCSDDYFSSYDLCTECYEQGFPQSHPHQPADFKKTCLGDILEAQALEDVSKGKNEKSARKKNYAPKHLRRGDKICSYCSSTTSSVWRKGFNGVLMCGDCFQLSRVQNSFIKSEAGTISVEEYTSQLCNYEECVDDYTHNPYLTRIACTNTLFDNNIRTLYLDSYAPTECHLFSLTINSTYYDVPGRAPRWATHSGTDYHGTWLPQSVRRALQKYTRPNERVLSNFLGRGTDAIESFLLARKCIGLDINPAAVALSRRNCSFAIPPDLGITAEHRPMIMQGDSRYLVGPLFEDESFDHVLSHPPYKDCVAYSTHIEGDLSRFAYSEDFLIEYSKVVNETWRVLKMGRRCTLGIGDNREHCFYIPVGFRMISKYIERGFELEELIVKRQRYCSAFGLGTYLCVQYDFLIFTHEFLVTLRKVDPDKVVTPSVSDNQSSIHEMKITETVRGIPYCPIARKSVVMGTVWTFKPSSQFTFVSLCTSRMVERFGRDGHNWEEIKIEFSKQNVNLPENPEIKPTNEIYSELEMSSYERSRLRRIQENNQKLLALGVISDLSEESDDISHCEKLQKLEPHPQPAPLLLVVIPHISNTVILESQLLDYRAAILRCAKQAIEKLPPYGDLIIGAQDVRLGQDQLYPLGIRILEDITNHVPGFRLKELIVTVPDGYAKDRRKQCNWEEFEEQQCVLEQTVDHVPIVHAYYLVFMKKPNSNCHK